LAFSYFIFFSFAGNHIVGRYPHWETQRGVALLPFDNVIHACHDSEEP
jgi:hypothetical protein